MTNYDNTVVSKTSTVTVQTAVASIENTYYSSLTDAVNDVTTATIIMLQDQVEEVTIASDKNITLNLNNKTLTGTISNNGNLYLSGGTIAVGDKWALVNNGVVNFYSGKIQSQGGWTVFNTETGTFIMTGGLIEQTCTNSASSAFLNRGKVTMSGGSIITTEHGLVSEGNGAYAVVTGGTINSTSNVRTSGIMGKR